MPGIKIKGLRWWMIGLFKPGSNINYLTRSASAAANKAMQKDLAINSEQLSLHRRVACP